MGLKERDLVLLSIGIYENPITTAEGYSSYIRLVKRFSKKYPISFDQSIKLGTYTQLVNILISEGLLVIQNSLNNQEYFVKLTDQGEEQYDLIQLTLTRYRNKHNTD